MAVKNGSQYTQRLNDMYTNIWLNGQQIGENLSEHPAFRGLIATQSELYDMQCDEQWTDTMTYRCAAEEDRIGMSFLQPKSYADLVKRRKMMALWASKHYGFLGRSPDYMNTALMAFYSAAELLAEQSPEYADNLRQYYHYCCKQDITLSHAFVQPQASRLSSLTDNFEDSLAAKVHEIDKDGMIVSGAFLINTQGATAEEILVYTTSHGSLLHSADAYSFMFAVPNNLPGMKLIGRESFVTGYSTYNYPLSSRYEEMDTFVIFDHVRIPRDRIFLYGNEDLSQQFLNESSFHAHVSHQILCRTIAKTSFFLGMAEKLGAMHGVTSSPFFVEQISTIIVALETLKSLLLASEIQAVPDRWGSYVPYTNSTLAANAIYPTLYPKLVDILQTLGASRLIMIPAEEDFSSPNGAELAKYLLSLDDDGKDSAAFQRLAWELCASSFAGRQAVYERFFFGNPKTVLDRLYNGYDGIDECTEAVTNFVKG